MKPLPAELNGPTWLHGLTLFTTIRTRWGQPLLWGRHLERLQASARWAGWLSPEPELPVLEPLPWGLLRLTLTPEALFYSHQPLTLGPKPQEGMTVRLTEVQVHPQLAVHKTGNYWPYRLAQAQAGEASETWLLDDGGHIVDGSRSAPLFRIAGEWVVPAGGLPSVTRAAFLQSRSWVVRPVRPKELAVVQQAYLCGSGLGIVPVREIQWSEARFPLMVSWPEGPEAALCWPEEQA